MPVNPIDYKPVFPKVNEIAKTKNDENTKTNALVQEQAKQTNKDTDHDLNKVRNTEKTEESKINAEEKKENNKKKNKKKKKNKDDDEGSVIDIKI